MTSESESAPRASPTKSAKTARTWPVYGRNCKPWRKALLGQTILTWVHRYQKTRRHEKIQMRKKIKQTEQSDVKSAAPEPSSTPLPQYLLDRNNPTNAKALSSAIKNKRSEKAAKYSVPLPKVRGISEEEMFKAVGTGKKTKKKSWKRMITKPTFGMLVLILGCLGGILMFGAVGPDFTRRPVKYERLSLHFFFSSSLQT